MTKFALSLVSCGGLKQLFKTTMTKTWFIPNNGLIYEMIVADLPMKYERTEDPSVVHFFLENIETNARTQTNRQSVFGQTQSWSLQSILVTASSEAFRVSAYPSW